MADEAVGAVADFPGEEGEEASRVLPEAADSPVPREEAVATHAELLPGEVAAEDPAQEPGKDRPSVLQQGPFLGQQRALQLPWPERILLQDRVQAESPLRQAHVLPRENVA